LKAFIRIESSYLQFLRILAVIGATIGLIGAVGAGIYVASNYSAEPKAVREQVSVDPAAFQLPSNNTAANAQSATSDAPTADPRAAKLADQWAAIYEKHARQLLGKGSLKPEGKTAMLKPFTTLLHDADRGEEFAIGWLKYLDAVLGRPDMKSYIAGSPDKMVRVMLDTLDAYEKSFTAEKQRIANDRERAKEDADAKKMKAIAFLPIAAGLFAGFIVFALLLLLVRAERSIRQIAANRSGA
jgi:hypothetical protein